MCAKGRTVKPVLRHHCREKPPVSQDHIFAAEFLRLNVVGHSNVGTPKTTYLQLFCGQGYGLSMALQVLLAVYVLDPKVGF